MDFHQAIAKVTASPQFKDWHKENKQAYLAHAFVMLDEPNEKTWQIGFYNPTTEKMVTFILDNTVKKTPEQEVLKKEGTIDKLNPENVKIPIEEALKTAEEIRAGKQHIKKFFIIQHTEGEPLYNITYVLADFKTLNIKINATTGKTIKHTIQDLVAFG